MVVDFTLAHIERLDEKLVDLLNNNRYPMTEQGAALLISVGVEGLRSRGVSGEEILQLVTMLLAPKEG